VVYAELQSESDIWRDHMRRWYLWRESGPILCQSAAESDSEGRSTRLWHRPHCQRSVSVPGHRHVQPQCYCYLGTTVSSWSFAIIVKQSS